MMTIAASELFAGVNATAALPKLQATIREWRPDLVVRDSVEFGALVAAEAGGVRHARVAVHSVSFEEVLPALVGAPIDALRAAAGLPPDDGASLRAEAVFSSFPASLDRVPDGSRMQAPLRARVVEAAPSSAPAAWAPVEDPRPLVYITFGTIVGSTPHLRSVYRTSLDAVADLPVRALLTTGRGLEPGALGAIPDERPRRGVDSAARHPPAGRRAGLPRGLGDAARGPRRWPADGDRAHGRGSAAQRTARRRGGRRAHVDQARRGRAPGRGPDGARRGRSSGSRPAGWPRRSRPCRRSTTSSTRWSD